MIKCNTFFLQINLCDETPVWTEFVLLETKICTHFALTHQITNGHFTELWLALNLKHHWLNRMFWRTWASFYVNKCMTSTKCKRSILYIKDKQSSNKKKEPIYQLGMSLASNRSLISTKTRTKLLSFNISH